MREDAVRCHWCGWEVVQADGPHPWPKNAATVDHLKPKCSGGSNEQDNLVIACRACNERRGNMRPTKWRAWLDGDGRVWRAAPPEKR